MADNILESQFDEISDDVFAELLDTPAQTAGTSDIIGGVKLDDKKDAPKDKATKDAPKDDKDKQDDPDKDKPKEKTQEEIDAEVEAASADAVPGDDKDKGKKDTKVDALSTADILKAKALGLIERGIWREVENLDTFEWTDENYGELATVQAQWSAEDSFNEMLDQSGDYGKAIFNHIKNGGDPKEIIDLFKEAKRVNNLDITEESGQQNIIREYYSKVLNWPESKITRFITSAIDNKALKEEATDVKTLLEAEIKAEVQAREQQQAEALKARQEQERNWAGGITTALKSREDLSEKEKRELHQNLLTYNQKLPDGRVVNQFTMDFMKLQQDPQQYIELVRFVKDPAKYTARIEKEKTKEAAKKSWEFIKGNNAVTKGGGSHSKQEASPAEDFKIDWKQAYK